MKKIAYITDSSIFLSEEQAKELGLYYIPLHVLISGEDFLEGVNLDRDYLVESIRSKISVTTSQPSPGEIMSLIEKLTNDGYECGIFSTIGSGLSKTHDNIKSLALSQGFEMHMIDSKSVGLVQQHALLDVKDLIENDNKTIEESIVIVNEKINRSKTYLVPDDLFHLSRGGRVTPAAATLGNLLKIKPILSLQTELGGTIDALDKVRTSKKAYSKMIALITDNRDLKDYHIMISSFEGDPETELLIEQLEKVCPNVSYIKRNLDAVIGAHTGLATVGIQIYPKQ